MAGHDPKYGPPGAEPPRGGSRNRRQRDSDAPSEDQLEVRDYRQGRQRQRARPESTAIHNSRRQGAVQKSNQARNRNSLAAQIRSLEKLLKHPNTKISAIVRQEKGRELAGLVLERERKKAKQRATKNLGKYHMVRFVERQKCEKRLKQLRKALILEQDSQRRRARQAKERAAQQDSDIEVDTDGGVILVNAEELAIEDQITQTEIDLNYTMYAPLGEKYISLFPPTGREKIAGVSHVSQSFLKPEEEAEVRTLKDDNVVRSNTGEKPPMWYRVRECMENGTLDQLREGKLTAAPVTLPQVGSKEEVLQRANNTPEWLDDDGVIAAEDLDSDEDSANDENRMDGGFFE